MFGGGKSFRKQNKSPIKKESVRKNIAAKKIKIKNSIKNQKFAL